MHPAARQTLLRASITNRLLTPRFVTLAAIRGNRERERGGGRRKREVVGLFSRAQFPAFSPPSSPKIGHCCDSNLLIFICISFLFDFDGFDRNIPKIVDSRNGESVCTLGAQFAQVTGFVRLTRKM